MRRWGLIAVALLGAASAVLALPHSADPPEQEVESMRLSRSLCLRRALACGVLALRLRAAHSDTRSRARHADTSPRARPRPPRRASSSTTVIQLSFDGSGTNGRRDGHRTPWHARDQRLIGMTQLSNADLLHPSREPGTNGTHHRAPSRLDAVTATSGPSCGFASTAAQTGTVHQHRAGERVWPDPDHLECHDDDRRSAASATGLVPGDEDRPGDRDHARGPAKRKVPVHDHDQVRRAASNELDQHTLRGTRCRSLLRGVGYANADHMSISNCGSENGPTQPDGAPRSAHSPLRNLDRSDGDGDLPGDFRALPHASRRTDERVRACERRQRELHD